MAKRKPFTWVVRFTIHPLAIADGFNLSDECALNMILNEIGLLTADEVEAEVISAPDVEGIANAMGYVPGNPGRKRVIDQIRKSNGPYRDLLWDALVDARTLLGSVAYVAEEGDTVKVLRQIDMALQQITARRGEAVEVED